MIRFPVVILIVLVCSGCAHPTQDPVAGPDALHGSGEPTANGTDPATLPRADERTPSGLQNGTSVTYRITAPTGGVGIFNVTFEDNATGWRRDGTPVDAYRAIANTSAWSAGGLPHMDELGDLRREKGMTVHFAKSSVEVLHLEITGAADPANDGRDHPRQAKFVDETFIAAMPPVEPILYSFLPTLHVGLRDWSGSVGDWWVEQTAAAQNDSSQFVQMSGSPLPGHPSVWSSFMWRALYNDTGPFPAWMRLDMNRTDSDVFGPSVTWMAELMYLQPGAGPAMLLGDASPPPLGALATAPLTQIKSPLGPTLFLPPLPAGELPFYNLSSLYALLSVTDDVVQWSTEEELYFYEIQWRHRSWYWVDGETGQGTEPTGQVPHRAKWVARFIQTGLDEPETQYVMEGSGTTLLEYQSKTFHEIPGPGSWPLRVQDRFDAPTADPLVTPDAALTLFSEVVGGQQIPDWIFWDTWYVGPHVVGVTQEFWDIRINCAPADAGPTTHLMIDARTGWIDQGFVERRYDEGPCVYSSNNILA